MKLKDIDLRRSSEADDEWERLKAEVPELSEPPRKNPAILAAFARMRRRQVAAVLPALALVPCAIWQDYRSLEIVPQKMLTLLLWALVAGYFVFSFFNWRCPACGARLPWSRSDLHVCPKCWALLRIVKVAPEELATRR